MKTDIAPPAGDDNRVVFGETIDVKIADIGILDRILSRPESASMLWRTLSASAVSSPPDPNHER